MKELNVRPTASTNNRMNSSQGHLMLIGKCLQFKSVLAFLANLQHLLFSEFRPVMPFSLGMPNLGNHVSHVLPPSPKEKVGGVYARGIVAFITYLYHINKPQYRQSEF